MPELEAGDGEVLFPPVPAGRRLVQVGDIIRHGVGNFSYTAIVAWVEDNPEATRLIFIETAQGAGAWRGTTAPQESLSYEGATDDGHWYSVAEDWIVIDSLWGNTLSP